jgi:succinate dehydrogenase flavin-adding protein (antitoxin of CptAB toxin-antitoxin module)
MRELDVLLTRYFDEDYSRATPAEQHAFRQLLECPDPLIHAYLLGSETPRDGALAGLLRRITASVPNDQY